MKLHVSALLVLLSTVPASCPTNNAGTDHPEQRQEQTDLVAQEGYKETGRATGNSLLSSADSVARVFVHQSGKPTILVYDRIPDKPLIVFANQVVLTVSSPDSTAFLDAAAQHIKATRPDMVVRHAKNSLVMLVRSTSTKVLTPEDMRKLIALPPTIRVTIQPNAFLDMQGNQDLLNPQDYDPQHEQWYLDNPGEFGGEPALSNADADGAEALVMMLRTGLVPAESTVVAIMDTGVNEYHPALSGALWTNHGEIPDNGRDDDGNGYVDDVHGWNFADDNAMLNDAVGHGTHVAGIIAARPTANGKGLYGVAPFARIMIVKIDLSSGHTSAYAVASAIDYAVANGAAVINMSFRTFDDLAAVRNALWNAALKDKVQFVAAAGNDALDLSNKPVYPCAYVTLTCVGATTLQDSLAGFSNYGGWVSGHRNVMLTAPGDDIVSTWGYDYKMLSGTSMAAPLVAGTYAALRGMYPNEDNVARRIRIYSNADRLPQLADKIDAGRRLNIYHAMFSRSDTTVGDWTDFTPYCEAEFTTAAGGKIRRRENHPYANSGEPNIDGSTEARAYKICTARQLAGIQDRDSLKTFSIAQTIYWDSTLNSIYGQPRYDSPAPRFNGKLLGNGYSIRNLKMRRPYPYGSGLFYNLGPRAEVRGLHSVASTSKPTGRQERWRALARAAFRMSRWKVVSKERTASAALSAS